MELERPEGLFDRAREWALLAQFVRDPRPEPLLAVVSGRRRQGKSFLLRRLVERTGGFYHQALQQEPRPALARLGRALADDLGSRAALDLPDLPSAVAALADLARTGPRLVVLDELPYLTARAPELPSALQLLIDEGRAAGGPPVRLVVCGSAISVMGGLLAGDAPLRGRALRTVVLTPFTFRDTARFWGVDVDPPLAFLLSAVLGGTPGYRDLAPAPTRAEEFTDWLVESVLDPSSALFHEDEWLLGEEPRLTDRTLYLSVLGAIAGGATTESTVAAELGRDRVAVQHPVRVLRDAGFLAVEQDALRQRRPRLRLVDPLVRFSQVVTRPDRARYEDRRAHETFVAARPRFRSNVLGPRLEELSREFTSLHAAEETTGGPVGRVASTVVDDPGGRTRHEVDVVALAPGSGERRPRVRLLGEAKLRRLGLADLERLERVRALVGARGRADVATARLALFSAEGFAGELVATARARPDVELIDLERLLHGA